jgi:hypothetical protein
MGSDVPAQRPPTVLDSIGDDGELAALLVRAQMTTAVASRLASQGRLERDIRASAANI